MKYTDETIARYADKLSANYHDILAASLNHDMRGIGEVLNIPIGTVKSRLHRARRKLDRLVADDNRVAALRTLDAQTNG